jgi:hypothetical protein
MIRRHVAVLVVLMSIAALGAGCENNPVGRLCDLGAAVPQVTETVLASNSLDCVSRTCLRVPPAEAMCTAECSVDEDCDRVPESPCERGFTCGIAVTAGPFCCQKFCICKDFLVIPESGQLDVPAACDANTPANKCCNLSGRTNSSDPNYNKDC